MSSLEPPSSHQPDVVVSPRTDFLSAFGWMGLGIAILIGSVMMDRLENQDINPYTIPGLLPGLLGIAMTILGALLAIRSWRPHILQSRDVDDAATSRAGRKRLALVLGLCQALACSVANVQVIGVNPKAPYQNAKELLDAMKAQPGKISVATAGVTSAGHNAMELISKVTGVKYRHVTYDGGNPAVVATVSGEAEVTTQLAVEQADMIRGKRLRPLATVSDKPLELEGYGTIPPLSDTIPGFTAPTNYFGIFIPKGVPDDVIATVQKVWVENIAKNEAVKKYALSRGALFAPTYGEAAQKAVFPAVQANAWLLFDTGKAKVSPDTVGIAKP